MNRLIIFLSLAALLAVGASPSVWAQSFPVTYGAFTVLADLDLSSTDNSSMNRSQRIALGDATSGYYIYTAVDASGVPKVYSLASNSMTPVLLSQVRATISTEAKALGLGFISVTSTHPYAVPFSTNGTVAGTQQLLSYPTNIGYMSAGNFGEANGLGYMGVRVTRSTRSSDAYLYKTNGTAAGTVQLKKWSTNTPSIGISGIREVGNLCVFLAWTGNMNGVWKSDGTAKGTVMIKSVSLAGSTTPVVCNGYYIFAATDANGSELWRSNGTSAGTVRVSDINPGAGSSSPNSLRVSGSKVYFIASNGSENTLYSYTPSSNTVAALSMNGATDPKWLTMLGGNLYYSAYTTASGRELWKCDPVANQSSLVKDIYVGTASGDPNYGEYTTEMIMVDPQSQDFDILGNYMYFAAKDQSSNDYMLWRSDGTEAGTLPVAGFSATGGTFPNTPTAAGGKLYFLARYSNLGNCLFVYDPAWTTPSPKQPTASATPTEFALGQNYPNPFNPSTVISYSLPKESAVTLTVTDMFGREVARLIDGEHRMAGTHNINFDAHALPSGIYVYRLEAGSAVMVRKMVLMR